MSSSTGLPDDGLARALRDLGAHLDLGPAASGSDTTLADSVLARIADDDRAGGGRGSPHRLVLLAAAAIVVVTLAGLLAVPPTREAIADWLGVGGVRISRTDRPPPTGATSTTSAGPASLPGTAIDEAEERLPFAVRRADSERAGPPLAVSVDPRLPSGLVEIRYRDFTLVELASAPGAAPVVEKSVSSGTIIRPVTVDGNRGYWLTGDPHQVGYIDVSGELDIDTVRRAGDVLVWEDRGVTYRIEGLDSFDAALEVAESLR